MAAEQPLYLIAMYIAQASGGVESLEATQAFTRDTCNNMASLVKLMNPEGPPPGYEIKLACDTKRALEQVIEQYDCRVVSHDNQKGLITSTYSCEPEQGMMAKVVRWFKSLLD